MRIWSHGSPAFALTRPRLSHAVDRGRKKEELAQSRSLRVSRICVCDSKTNFFFHIPLSNWVCFTQLREKKTRWSQINSSNKRDNLMKPADAFPATADSRDIAFDDVGRSTTRFRNFVPNRPWSSRLVPDASERAGRSVTPVNSNGRVTRHAQKSAFFRTLFSMLLVTTWFSTRVESSLRNSATTFHSRKIIVARQHATQRIEAIDRRYRYHRYYCCCGCRTISWSRMTDRTKSSPALMSLSWTCACVSWLIGSPFSLTITSPACKPAVSARPPIATLLNKHWQT